MSARLLVIDDNADLRKQAVARIRSVLPDVEAVEACGEAEFELALQEPEFDAVVAGAKLGWSSGALVLESARRRWPDMPVVLYRDATEVADSVRIALSMSTRGRERRATESLFRIMFEQSLSGLYVGTLDGALVDCNPAFARMFGYQNPGELHGCPATALVADPAAVELDRSQMLENGGILSNRHSMARRKDGTIFPALYSARVYDEAPPGLVLATIVDVTELQRARDDLRKAAMEWRTTFDAIAAPIVMVRPDGVVLRVNAGGKLLAGREFRAIVGLRLGTIGPGEPWQAAAGLVDSVAREERTLAWSVRDPATGRTWEVNASPAGAGEDQVVALVMRDISDVVSLQETVVRNQTMSALGQLVAGVAHEVRSPLFGISATLDAFEARYGQEPNFRTYLDNLRREISRLNDLMGDLLELGKPATTPRQQERLGGLIEESVEVCQALAAEREVTLVQDLSGRAASAMVLVDRRRLLQVFENLVENAIHHSPAGANVTIRDDPDRLDQAELTISVYDEGTGFRPEDLSHLFEPFFTRRTGGTGLGLAIVRRILEDHGGSAVAENRRGGGAVVHVSLPLHLDQAEETP